jgi:hypothetical protein
MELFAAGIAVLALLFATYTTHRTWLAWGSAALSLVALIGAVFFLTAKDADIRDGYVRLADQLSPVLDRQAIDELKGAIEQVAAYEAPRPAPAPADERPAMQAAAVSGWLAPEKPKPVSGDAVAWLLEERVQVPVSDGDRFRLGGINLTDEAMTDVRGALKPDLSGGKLKLALDVEDGASGDGVVPPGARFSLVRRSGGDSADATTDRSGGAILTFRYAQSGQQKSMILYLTPPMLARLGAQQ